MAGKRTRAAYEADLQTIKSPYVFYGTPLPPLDSNVRDDGSFVPIWKQEVTDERGRKRLHGAFTGGFSAGYFNTVGSKEGWTPSTFVSSKSNRWKDSGSKTQKAEDYMDDEDKVEAEEARQVSTKSGFAGLGSTEDEVYKRAPLMDLFRSAGDTMGFNLLRKMGWKDGQGIGPRVWRTADLDDSKPSGTSAAEQHLFAPKNSKLILILRKDDRKGLGYGGSTALEKPVRSSARSVSDDEEEGFRIKPKKPAKKGAFGVGVLNDTGSDDEDPFSLGPKISYSKVLGSDKKKKKKLDGKIGSSSNPLLSKKPVFISNKANKALAGFRKCHDGRLPLEGFILSVSKPIIESNKYPPPKVPDDWKPSRLGADSTTATEWQSSSDLAKASTLEPSARGNLLGEAPLPTKSVFDFMKPEARARLVNLTKNEALPPARSESVTQIPSTSSPPSIIPPLDPAIASSALGRGIGGFVPYTDNPDKLSRYRAYLSYSAGLTSETPSPAANTSREEFHRELQEFAHAATIFKPMTGSIATRFTSASAASLLPKSTSTGADHNNDNDKENPLKAQHPAEAAASLSMFGHLTRSSQFFYPSRLLCKRFNVPVPAHVHSGNEGSTGRGFHENASAPVTAFAPLSTASGSGSGRGSGSKWHSAGLQLATNQEPLPSIPRLQQSPAPQVQTMGAAQDILNLQSKTCSGPNLARGVDPERNEALEQDRAGDDVFRAVFGGDGDSEDD